jgi:hypothetical protein
LAQAAHGQDSNGAGLRSAIANTEWGKIPGCVRDSESVCYFVYRSTCGNTTDYTIVKGAVFSDDSNDVLPLGEEDGDEYFCAVASTPYGRLPGKAKDGTFYYAYDNGGSGGGACYCMSVSYLGPRKSPLDVAAAETKAKASK